VLGALIVCGLGLGPVRICAGRLRLSRGRGCGRSRGRGPCRDLGEADAGGRGEREPDDRSDDGAPAESADSFLHGGIPSVRGSLTFLSRRRRSKLALRYFVTRSYPPTGGGG